MAKKTFETVLKWNGGEAGQRLRSEPMAGAGYLIRLTVCTAAQ